MASPAAKRRSATSSELTRADLVPLLGTPSRASRKAQFGSDQCRQPSLLIELYYVFSVECDDGQRIVVVMASFGTTGGHLICWSARRPA